MTQKETVTIAVLAGTTRAKRESIHAARYVADYGRGIDGVEIIFVDPVDFTFPRDGDDPEGKDPHYTNITERADAFFIVSPEYNHGIPGSLKRMIDSEYDNYYRKPVALAGASSGQWGGVRAVQALALTARRVGMVLLPKDAYFPYVQTMFDEHGMLKPEVTEDTNRMISRVYTQLIWMAKTLKQGRDTTK